MTRKCLIEARCVKKEKGGRVYRRIETNCTFSLLLRYSSSKIKLHVKIARFPILLSVLLKYVRAHCATLKFLFVPATQRRTMRDQLGLHLNAYPRCNFLANPFRFFSHFFFYRIYNRAAIIGNNAGELRWNSSIALVECLLWILLVILLPWCSFVDGIRKMQRRNNATKEVSFEVRTNAPTLS